MSTAVHEACTCGLEVKPEIWLCPHHVYRKGKQEFVSVSKVKKTLLPEDYSGVPADVLENARQKGVFIDAYFSEYLTLAPNETMMSLLEFHDLVEPNFVNDKYATREQHAQDALTRLDMLLNWWAASGLKAVDVQRIAYSESDGIAGTFDLGTEEFILDLKCVSSLQPNYKLQLGAYSVMDPQAFPLRDVAIIHVTKDKVKLVKYKTRQCRDQWKACLGWYKTLGELNA